MTGTEQSSSKVTFLWVAERVLADAGRPLRAGEIISIGTDKGFFGDLAQGKTPQKSMQARLSIDILNNGAESKFLRTGRGMFDLRGRLIGSKRAKAMQEYKAPRRAPLPSSEKVLVISREGYQELLSFNGIETEYPKERLKKLLESKHVFYLPRSEAEINDDVKQFVTYTIIQRKTKVLAFRRGQYNRTANFLRGSLCIGFGGHVTEDDSNLLSYRDKGIKANAARELSEEIQLPSGRVEINPEEIDIAGILNDDSSDVGVRHLAIVLRYFPPDTDDWNTPQRGEASINQLSWVNLESSKKNLLDFEYWSQLCLRSFFKDAILAKPIYRIVCKKPFQKKCVLCVVGTVGSGKSVTTRCLQQNADYVEVNSGKVLAGLLGIPPVPETPRADFQDQAQKFISAPNGPRLLAEAILAEASRLNLSKIVIDGIRQIDTLRELRNLSQAPIALIYVHTPPDLAYQLYANREASGAVISFQDFISVLKADVELDIKNLIRDADVIIYNWFGVEGYRLMVNNLIEELGLKDESSV